MRSIDLYAHIFRQNAVNGRGFSEFHAKRTLELEGTVDIDIDIGDEFYRNLLLSFRRIRLERVLRENTDL